MTKLRKPYGQDPDRGPISDHGAEERPFSDRLHTLRKQLGLSQEQLARRLDVSFATINRWEGGRTRPNGATIARVLAFEAYATPSDSRNDSADLTPAGLVGRPVPPESASDATRTDGARALADRTHLASVASDLGSKLLGPEQSAVVERLDALSDRLDVTLSWAEEHGDASLGLSLVASLWNWWLIKGRVAEGRRWVETFLTGSAGTTDTMVFARASLAGAVFCAEQGEYDLARERGQVAADCFADAGDDVGTGDAARVLSIVARYKGELDAAESLLEGALTAYRSASDTRGISTALNNLAALAIDGGDLGRGRELLVESISTKRVLGDRRSLASSLVNLADLSVQDDSPRAAIALLQEARSIAEEIHDARLLAFVEHNFGDAELASGNGRGSIGHYETALHLFEQSEAARDVTLALCSLGRALHATGAQSRAVTMLRRSESIAASLGDAQRVAEARAALAACGEIPKKTPLPGGLTDREADVIGLLAAGLSNRNIAERLVVSVSTVERHVANIYSKLSIHSRVEATRFALRNGLVGTPS